MRGIHWWAAVLDVFEPMLINLRTHEYGAEEAMLVEADVEYETVRVIRRQDAQRYMDGAPLELVAVWRPVTAIASLGLSDDGQPITYSDYDYALQQVIHGSPVGTA